MTFTSKILYLNWTKKFSLLICFLFLSSFLISEMVEYYRMVPELNWIYEYGESISNFLFLGTLIWSLFNSILIVTDINLNWKESTIWTLISLIPIFYIGFVFFAWSKEI
jgi:hypothetical protein